MAGVNTMTLWIEHYTWWLADDIASREFTRLVSVEWICVLPGGSW